MKEKNTTENVPITFHTSGSSVGVEINVHGTNMFICVNNVAYCDGKIKMDITCKGSMKKKNEKEKNKSGTEDFIMVTSSHTFDVRRFTQENKNIDSTND